MNIDFQSSNGAGGGCAIPHKLEPPLIFLHITFTL